MLFLAVLYPAHSTYSLGRRSPHHVVISSHCSLFYYPIHNVLERYGLGMANPLEDNFLTRDVLTIVSVHGYLHFPTSSSGHM